MHLKQAPYSPFGNKAINDMKFKLKSSVFGYKLKNGLTWFNAELLQTQGSDHKL